MSRVSTYNFTVVKLWSRYKLNYYALLCLGTTQQHQAVLPSRWTNKTQNIFLHFHFLLEAILLCLPYLPSWVHGGVHIMSFSIQFGMFFVYCVDKIYTSFHDKHSTELKPSFFNNSKSHMMTQMLCFGAEYTHSLSIRNTLIRKDPSNSSIIRNHDPLNFQETMF